MGILSLRCVCIHEFMFYYVLQVPTENRERWIFIGGCESPGVGRGSGTHVL